MQAGRTFNATVRNSRASPTAAMERKKATGTSPLLLDDTTTSWRTALECRVSGCAGSFTSFLQGILHFSFSSEAYAAPLRVTTHLAAEALSLKAFFLDEAKRFGSRHFSACAMLTAHAICVGRFRDPNAERSGFGCFGSGEIIVQRFEQGKSLFADFLEFVGERGSEINFFDILEFGSANLRSISEVWLSVAEFNATYYFPHLSFLPLFSF